MTQSIQIKSNVSQFYRFPLFQAVTNNDVKLEKKTVGMAYLKEGQNIYTVRLWTFLNERYYAIPSRTDSAKYLIMTREPNRNPSAKNKFFWNIVGNGNVNSKDGVVELRFDLWPEPIYMSLFPEKSAQSAMLADPVPIVDAA